MDVLQQAVEEGRLLRGREVAAILNVNPRTPFYLSRSGVLPAIKLGPKCVRFHPSDVQRLIESRREAS